MIRLFLDYFICKKMEGKESYTFPSLHLNRLSQVQTTLCLSPSPSLCIHIFTGNDRKSYITLAIFLVFSVLDPNI
ncbi:hypothetical protein RchiOBHm_Chr1g0363611 [Rosa chinensis]|uniref:Uncharacterized protein n=1 Tax=Rosa chinensis TaxID=74649 RepID=A0A2P6SJH7_ROSCH|nr:hypothetical protein RchiOBHm_Chr1g0363611 [Rosa chinensis]